MFSKKLFGGLVITLAVLNACGSSGGNSPGSGNPDLSESSSEEAYTQLSGGDIAGAKDSYDQALAQDPNNATAAFGAALARIILMTESAPSQNILEGFGQSAFSATSLVGPTSYLAALNDINASTISLDGYDGPFFGKAQTFESEYRNYDYSAMDDAYNACADDYETCSSAAESVYEACLADEEGGDAEEGGDDEGDEDGDGRSCDDEADVSEDECDDAYNMCLDNNAYAVVAPIEYTCRSSGVTLEYRDAANSLHLTIGITLTLEAEQGGNVVGSFNAVVGSSFNIAHNIIDLPNCRRRAIYAYVETTDGGYYDSTEGTIALNSISTSEGEEFEIGLDNVTFEGWGDEDQRGSELVLNGTISDTITNIMPERATYFPFYNLPDRTLSSLLSRVSDDLNANDFQGYLAGYQPLFGEIDGLLAQADRNNNFQFVIPKQLYFGVDDVPVNRIDLKLFRAGFDLARAGLYAANSWEFPIDIGALYNENGELLITQAELVDQLNRFFTLKSNHQLDEAQIETVEGLQNVLDAFDLLDDVTVDGIAERSAQVTGGYAELQDAVEIIQRSLSETVTFDYVEPAVTINLGRLFTNPPNASEVDFDPFVIENGKIRPVEMFFQQMLAGTVDFDLVPVYRDTFSVINRNSGDFRYFVLDEFRNFFVAGTLVSHLQPKTGP